jgi:hypothetical protein
MIYDDTFFNKKIIENIIMSKIICFKNPRVDVIIKNLLNDVGHQINELNNIKNSQSKRDIMRNELYEYALQNDTFNFDNLYKINDCYELDKYIYHINTGAYGSVFRIDSNLCIKCIYAPIDNQMHEYEIPIKLTEYFNSTKNNCVSFLNVPYALIKKYNLEAIEDFFKLHSFILLILRQILDDEIDYSHINIGYMIDSFKIMEDNYKYLFINASSEQIVKNYKYCTYLYNKYSIPNVNMVLFNKFDSLIEFFKKRCKDNRLNNFRGGLRKNVCIKNKINNIKYKQENIDMINKFKKIKKNALQNEMPKKCKINDLSNGTVMIMQLAICSSHELKLNNDLIPDMLHGEYAIKQDPDFFRYLILQMFILILSINETKFIFAHNDLKPNNILVFHNIQPLIVKYKNKTLIFNKKYIFKLTDFDFSNLKLNNYVNKKIEDKSYLKKDHITYDIYYFLFNIKHYFFKGAIEKDDPDLYLYISKFLREYDNSNNLKASYMGTKILSIKSLEDLIFNKNIFDKWIM